MGPKYSEESILEISSTSWYHFHPETKKYMAARRGGQPSQAQETVDRDHI